MGRPAVTVVTEAFQTAADARAAVLGLPEHPRVIVEHPLASRTPSEIEKVAVAAVARIAAGLSGQATSPASGSVQHVAKTRPAPARAQRRQLAGDFAEANEALEANATIGRALRLVMRNLGGAKPDGMEKSTQAWPGKIACCFAENEARSPWEPLHVERGHPAGASTVTVVAVRGIYSLTEGRQTSG